MRILIASETYRPAANGQAVFTTQLAEGLAAAGHHVMVVLPSDRLRGSTRWQNGVRLAYLPAIPIGFPDSYFAPIVRPYAERLIKSFKPDVVHIQDHYPFCRSFAAVARRHGLPTMGTNHFVPENVIHYILPVKLGRRLMTRFLWWTMLSCYRRLDAVSAPSKTAIAILDEQQIDVPLYAISCGVDVDRFSKETPAAAALARQKYGIPSDKPVFLFVGRLAKEKRIEVIFEALTLMDEDAVLVVTGHGPMETTLRRAVEHMDLQSKVVFTGWVPGEDLPEVLAAVDVFIMPSEAELLSIATLEAMSAGKPILVARAQALPELVEEGVNGYTFEPRSASDLAIKMSGLISEQDRWPAMGLAGQDRARYHQVESTIKRYERVYLRLKKAHGPVSEPASWAAAD